MVEDAFKLSQEARTSILARVAASNVIDDPETEGMAIEYDPELDYLHIGLGEPREALAISMEDRVDSILLYDPETYEIVGIEVPFFKEKRQKGLVEGDFWQLIATYIDKHGPSIYIASKQETELAGKAFRDLVSA